MACNCEGNTYRINFGCCTPIVANPNAYYTKSEIDDIIENIEVSGECCITEEQVDEKLATKLDASAYTPTDLSNYDTKSEVNTKISNATSLVYNSLTAHTANTDIHVTTAQTNAWDNKLDASAYTPTDLSDYYTSAQTESAITQAVSGKQDSISAGSGITINNNTVSLDVPIYKGSGASSVSVNMPSSGAQGTNRVNGDFSVGMGSGVNTSNPYEAATSCFNVSRTDSQFTFGSSGRTLFEVGNGSNTSKRHNAFEVRQNGDIYIVDTDSPNTDKYYEKPMIRLQDHLGGGGSGMTSGEVQTMINNSISGKQDTLSAGTNITISGNVISAASTDLSNYYTKNETNTAINNKFYCCSASDWETISGSTQPNVLYLVYDD